MVNLRLGNFVHRPRVARGGRRQCIFDHRSALLVRKLEQHDGPRQRGAAIGRFAEHRLRARAQIGSRVGGVSGGGPIIAVAQQLDCRVWSVRIVNVRPALDCQRQESGHRGP